jgi:hypothetical protein
VTPFVGLVVVPVLLIGAIVFFVWARRRERRTRGATPARTVPRASVLILIAAIVFLWIGASVVVAAIHS